MSRVDAAPTYLGREFLQVMLEVTSGGDKEGYDLGSRIVARSVGNEVVRATRQDLECGDYREYNTYDYRENDYAPNLMSDEDSLWSRACTERGRSRKGSDFDDVESTREFWKGLLDKGRTSAFVWGEDARRILVGELIENHIVLEETTQRPWQSVSAVVDRIVEHNAAGDKLSARSALFAPRARLSDSRTLQNDYAVALALTQLTTIAPSRSDVFDEHRHKLKEGKLMINGGIAAVYKWKGYTVFVCRGRFHEVLILHQTSLESVAERAWSCLNLRHMLLNAPEAEETAMHELCQIMARSELGDRYNRRLGMTAKVFKTAGSAELACVAREFEAPFAQATARREAIYEQALEVDQELTRSVRAWVVRHSALPGDVLVDMLNLYHLLPSPSISMDLVLQTLRTKMNSSYVQSNARVVDRFLLYARQSIAVTLSTQRRKLCFSIEGMTQAVIEVQPWYKQIMQGKRPKLPEDLWSKVVPLPCLHRMDSVELWDLHASDVGHVCEEAIENAKKYLPKHPRFCVNEATYAVTEGPKLSHVHDPEELRVAIERGGWPFSAFSKVSGKAENTKYGEKSRDIHSSLDLVREALSELDSSISPLCSVFNGPVMRASSSELERIHRNCSTELRGGRTVALSADVSSWSAAMPQRLLTGFLDVCGGFYFEKLPDLAAIFEKLELFVTGHDRPSFFKPTDGALQGWTASLDTLMHAVIVGFCVHTAKEESLLLETESARTVTLIDDMAAIFNLAAPAHTCSDRLERLFSHFDKQYLCLGLKMDNVKSLFSSRLYTFLNRVFVAGAELPGWRKLFLKIRVDYVTPFQSTAVRAQGVFSSACGALGRGSDPVTTYLHALEISVATILFSHLWQNLQQLPIEQIAFHFRAPGGMGGYGLPPLLSLTTGEFRDTLATFLAYEQARQLLLRAAGAHALLEEAEKTLGALLSVGPQKRGVMAIVADPVTYHLELPPTADSVLENIVKNRLRNIAKNDVYVNAVQDTHDDVFANELTAIFSCVDMHAAYAEAFGAALPDAWLAELSRKMVRVGSILSLLRVADRRKVKKRIRERELERTQRVVQLLLGWRSADSVSVGSAYATARRLRREMYMTSGVSIFGSTAPCPSTVVQRVPTNGSIRVTMTHPLDPYTADHTERYDFSRGSQVNVAFRSRSASFLDNSDTFNIPSFLRPILDFLVMSAACKTGPTSPIVATLVSIVSKRWTGDPASFAKINIPLPAGISLKRFVSSLSHHEHRPLTACNIAHSIRIDDTKFRRATQLRHKACDPSAVLNYLRTTAAIDACYDAMRPDEVRHYDFVEEELGREDENIMFVEALPTVNLDNVQSAPLRLEIIVPVLTRILDNLVAISPKAAEELSHSRVLDEDLRAVGLQGDVDNRHIVTSQGKALPLVGALALPGRMRYQVVGDIAPTGGRAHLSDVEITKIVTSQHNCVTAFLTVLRLHADQLSSLVQQDVVFNPEMSPRDIAIALTACFGNSFPRTVRAFWALSCTKFRMTHAINGADYAVLDKFLAKNSFAARSADLKSPEPKDLEVPSQWLLRWCAQTTGVRPFHSDSVSKCVMGRGRSAFEEFLIHESEQAALDPKNNARKELIGLLRHFPWEVEHWTAGTLMRAFTSAVSNRIHKVCGVHMDFPQTDITTCLRHILQCTDSANPTRATHGFTDRECPSAIRKPIGEAASKLAVYIERATRAMLRNDDAPEGIADVVPNAKPALPDLQMGGALPAPPVVAADEEPAVAKVRKIQNRRILARAAFMAAFFVDPGEPEEGSVETIIADASKELGVDPSVVAEDPRVQEAVAELSTSGEVNVDLY